MPKKCIGHRIQGRLQAYCPVRKTCSKYLNAKPGDDLYTPQSAITQAGCGEYKRISAEEFKKKPPDPLII